MRGLIILKGDVVSKIVGGNRTTDPSNCGSRAANWNNYPWNGNWNNGLRAACDDLFLSSPVLLRRLRWTPLRWSAPHLLLRRIHYWVQIAVSSLFRKPHWLFGMGKKYKNLFQEIVDPSNMREAYRRTSRGKRTTWGYLEFKENDGANLHRLRESLIDGSYRPGEERLFTVMEPKPRNITAMPFVDRVVQHALCGVIEPIFDKVFLPQSYACRVGKGTHAAARDLQAAMRREPEYSWHLKTDFQKYFFSIGRQVLWQELMRKIGCHPTLRLISKFLPWRGFGIPIGHLLSQLLANLKGHVLDRWLVHCKGVTRFYRYMDDVVILGRSKDELSLLFKDMSAFVEKEMGLQFSKWAIEPTRRGVNFVGYRIWLTHKLLRKDSVARARRKLRRLSGKERERFLASWLGHASHADTHNLLKSLELA